VSHRGVLRLALSRLGSVQLGAAWLESGRREPGRRGDGVGRGGTGRGGVLTIILLNVYLPTRADFDKLKAEIPGRLSRGSVR
jgi:hypothetical protein